MLSVWMARWRRDAAAQGAVALLALTVLGVFLAGAYRKADRPIGYDVHCFLATARAVRAGGNPYLAELPIPYNYPLFVCTAAVPLTFLPEWLVHAGWFVATVAAWACAAFLLVRRLPASTGLVWDRGLLLPLVGASLLLIGPIQSQSAERPDERLRPSPLRAVLVRLARRSGRPRRLVVGRGRIAQTGSRPVLRAASAATVVGRPRAGLPLDRRPVRGAPRPFPGDRRARRLLVLRPALPIGRAANVCPLRPVAHFYTLHGALSWLAPACKTALAAKVGAALVVLAPLCVVDGRGGGPAAWRRFALLEAYLAAILLLSPLSEPHHLTLLLPCAWVTALRGWRRPDVLCGRSCWNCYPMDFFPSGKSWEGRWNFWPWPGCSQPPSVAPTVRRGRIRGDGEGRISRWERPRRARIVGSRC